MKKVVFILVAAAVMVIGVTAAFASDVFKTPAETVSQLTGKTVDEVTQARQDGVTYGAQAALDGKLDEFKAARLEQCKKILDQAVKDGRLTRAQADARYEAMKQRMENCDGDGAGAGGCGAGRGFGCGIGGGKGYGRNAGGLVGCPYPN